MKKFLTLLSKGFISLIKSIAYIVLCIIYLPCYLLAMLFTLISQFSMSLLHKLW